MKLLLLLCLFFGRENDLGYIRELYVKAASAETDNQLLLKTLAENKNRDVVREAYVGAATMLMAKHCMNPYNKLKHFNAGKQILEKAIKADPKNVEARFLRFTIQSNLPDFLGYKDQMPSDKKFLIASLNAVSDPCLLKTVCNYLQQKADLSKEEKSIIIKTAINTTLCTSF